MSWHGLCTYTGRSNEGHATIPALGRADAQNISLEDTSVSHCGMALSQTTSCRDSRVGKIRQCSRPAGQARAATLREKPAAQEGEGFIMPLLLTSCLGSG